MFNGSLVALVTPFRGNEIDEIALKGLVRFHLENGTHGLVPVGTTGESPTLSTEEHQRVVEIVVHEAGGVIPVIAGAGSNNTAEAIHFTRHAEKTGADATLHVMGYYNRPSQAGILQHFAAVNDAATRPIIVYNIPARAVIDIEVETMAQLARFEHIAGVKDATKDLTRPLREAALIDEPFSFLSGEDGTAVAYNASGGSGCISVTANIAPALCAEMQEACLAGDFVRALEVQRRLMPLHEALFIEPNPAGAKYAAARLGLAEPGCRLPIVALAPETQRIIDQVLEDLDLG